MVETVHLALAELVKNAYDADATEVLVIVAPAEDGKSVITVSDNGSGMTFEDVKAYWMRIATTNKVGNQVSPRYGRPKTGSKGIGRFSCRRLGTKLELETTGRDAKGIDETTHVTFDWKDYVPGTDVTKITCPGEVAPSEGRQTGTKLVITGGSYEEWNRRSWNTLKRQMVVLVANRGVKRPGFEEDPGFNIKLGAPGLEDDLIANPREQLMQAGWGTLRIAVADDGTLECSLEAKKIGRRNYTLREAYPALGGTTAEIAILPTYSKEQLRNTRVLSLGNLQKILPDWGGVFVRQHGFRVYPFGAPGNDWLHIDRDRGRRLGTTEFDVLRKFARKLEGVESGRELLNMLSSQSYVGSVEVASPDPGLFEMKANREGFVGERGISVLRKAVRFAIDWTTIYRDYYLRLVEREKAQAARKEFEKAAKVQAEPQRVIKTAAVYIKEELSNLTQRLPLEKRQMGRALTKAADAILQSEKATGEELRHLRLVASTSSLLLIFAHDVKSLLGDLDHYGVTLDSLARALSGSAKEKVKRIRQEILDSKHRFVDLLEMTSLISVDSKTAKVRELALRDRVEKAIGCYKLVTDRYEISVDATGVAESLKTGKILEAEVYSILLNVLSNAIKAVIAKGGTKEIFLAAEKVAGGTRLNVFDTGVGVKPERSEDLFVPFVADPEGTLYPSLKKRMNPEDEYIVGTGSGLGLSIVREIVQSRCGEVCFRPAKGKWRTNLEILLP